MELQNIISSNIQAFRSRLGLTQDQIAEFLDVDQSLIEHYEKGTREVTYVQLKKLSNLFNIELEDLIEENSALSEIQFTFHVDGTDLKSISEFHKVVRNYIEMSKMKNE